METYWLNLILDLFGLFMYTGDTCTNLIVAIELFNRCHYRLASFLVSFMIMPGFTIGFLTICSMAKSDGFSFKNFLALTAPLLGLFAGIVFIPFGFIMLIWSAIKPDSIGRDDTATL